MTSKLVNTIYEAAKYLETYRPDHMDRMGYTHLFQYLSHMDSSTSLYPQVTRFDVKGEEISFQRVKECPGENGGHDQYEVYLVTVGDEATYIQVGVYYDSWDGYDYSDSVSDIKEVFPAVVTSHDYLPAEDFRLDNVEYWDTGVKGLPKP